jgi:hypothetical protein
VGDLGDGVHAGVGASGTVDLEAVAPGRLAHGLDQLALDGPRVGLDLPAAVARAGVLDGQLEPGHRLPSLWANLPCRSTDAPCAG